MSTLSPFGPVGQMAFPEVPPPAMKRPSERDAYVQDRILELVLPRFRDWIVSAGGCYEEDSVRDELRNAMFKGLHRDGYQMARELERQGWDPDAELVDLLDGLWTYRNQAVRELTAQWVNVCQIRPQFHVGDEVVMLRGYPNSLNRGIITRIEEPAAVYYVHCADQPDTSNWVVEYEAVESAS